jgi:hypothetical protein
MTNIKTNIVGGNIANLPKKAKKRNPDSEHDHTLHIADLTSTLFCKMGHCLDTNDKVVQSLLHLSGMDVSEPYEIKVVTDGSGYRTKNNEVVYGGVLYTGYKRFDYDEQMCDSLLNTQAGVAQLASILNLEV